MPNTGITNLSIIPVRSQPSERSEMLTQLIFGELYDILDEKDGWILISSAYDKYEGWIDKKMSLTVTQEYVDKLSKFPVLQVIDTVGKAINQTDHSSMHLVQGSILPFFKGGFIDIGIHKLSFEGNLIEIPAKPDFSNLENFALSYLNVPYLWGGRTPFGIDCSGFVQMVYKSCGVILPRDASQQANSGETINFIYEALPYDLAFFDNSSGIITHVGIILGEGRIIHASGCVRVDRIDHNGIFNTSDNKYSYSLRIIKRFIA